ncbi:MAG: tyrosine-type recombinase/integrase [Bacillota bacterium]|nr:tyrosine-type recombinase/integrase [Bacillota bacterium]
MKNKKLVYKFRGPFKEHCEKYIEYKKSLGYKFGKSSYYSLRYMDDFFIKYKIAKLILTKEMVYDYVAHRGTEAIKTQHMRMSLIRQFALFMNTLGFSFFVYPNELVRVKSDFVPYIFTENEINKLYKIVDNLKFTPRSKKYHLIYPMLFRVLYSTGLRITETLKLKRDDIDLDKGIITITNAKNNSSRFVPMSDSLVIYAKEYVKKIGFKSNYNSYFFPSRDGGRYNRHPVSMQFKKFMKEAGIYSEGEVAPRLHDIRHTFSVHALEKMISENKDVYTTLPILSVYLGHKDIESTEKYLRLTKESYQSIINKMAPSYNKIFPEGDQND